VKNYSWKYNKQPGKQTNTERGDENYAGHQHQVFGKASESTNYQTLKLTLSQVVVSV